MVVERIAALEINLVALSHTQEKHKNHQSKNILTNITNTLPFKTMFKISFKHKNNKDKLILALILFL